MAYRKSLDFLPSIFQTRTNDKLLRATMDQLISEPEIRKLDGFIGRKFNPALTPTDSYIQESYIDRQNYQLEPASIYSDSNDNIKFVANYVDLLDRIESLGGNSQNPSRLFGADQYSYSGLFDFDKFVNYSSYYWLPNGPDSVGVFATEIPVDQDIAVTIPSIYSVVNGKYDIESFDSKAFDVSDNDIARLSQSGYTFDTTGNRVNPVIRVARGGTYRFNVNQSGHGFFIQSVPGNDETYPWQKNLSIREILGVENNGEDVGTVTFNVPAKDAQDFFLRMEYKASVNLVAYSFLKRRQLRYNEVQSANYQDFLREHVGIDGQRFIEGKNVLFLPSRSETLVPQPWMPRTQYSEGDLLVYGNTVYRVMINYISGRTFSSSNLERYDLEDHWYDPGVFDSSEVGFDSANFDRGDDVPAEQRLGWFTVNINSDGIINLTPISSIETNKRVFIGEGVEYGNREIYRTANNKLQLVPPITANLDYLYYQDSLDPRINGIIEIVDQDNNLQIDVSTILNNDEYTSPNGVVFENGLKVRFVGKTSPSQYENKTYYVEGVGSSIELVDVETLFTPERWLDTVSTPFDIEPFDSQGFDESQPAPINKQYIGIKRNSREGSAWTRQNRWFHENVIKNTNLYNGFNTVLNQNSRAKRPIIEFDANLQLYNFGSQYKTSVTVVDIAETDALSNVEGVAVEAINNIVSGFYSDGIPLVNGNRVIFANDNSADVRKTIYRVEWITPESSINNRVATFTGDGVTSTFDLNFNVASPTRLLVQVNGVNAQDAGYFWTISGQNIIFVSPIPDQADITVNYTFGQQIHLVPVDTIQDNEVVLSSLGNVNQGTTWVYKDNVWVKTQNKNQDNQAPLFDLYDSDGVSISNENTYLGSSFAGNKIFSYKIGNTAKDSELGIRLAYRSIGNVGDILFVDHIANDRFTYESVNEETISSSTTGLDVKKNITDKNSVFVNQWVKLTNKSKQYQTETFFASQYQKNNFALNITPDALGPENILVYKNNVALTEKDFDVEIIAGTGYLILNSNLVVNDKLDVKIFSNNFNSRSIWEIPSNLENNAQNQDVVEITLGQLRNHILESFIKTPNFEGSYQGSNNAKDLPNIKANGGKILQNAGAPHLANLFLNDVKANFVESLLYSQREYTLFKNKFQRLAGELPLRNINNEALCVDEILNEIFSNKNEMFPFYRSDMTPAGNDYTKINYVVDNPVIDTYYLSRPFDINVASNRAVIIYLNGVQLTYELDYTFSSTQPIVQFNIPPERLAENKYYLNISVGDVIEIREYNNTDGFHVPPTPTKLGMYPAYRPKIIVDGYSGATVTVIRGHDGSLITAYGDFRDNIILELEKRIYNNIKSRYNDDLFDIYANTPGAFRSTDYTKTEFDTVLSSNFSTWLGKNNLQLDDFTVFDSNDPFSWNYRNYFDIVSRTSLPAANWRNLYKHFYDTDQPHQRPWEMLGFTEEPDWWNTEYGPSPYTSGNTVLWDDLEAGRIKQGIRAGIDNRFIRPGLKNIIPVDDGGTLLSPFNCLVANSSPGIDGSWKFGDGGPVETAWRQSSEYPYAIQLAMALTKPAEYFGLFRDTINQVKRVYDTQENFQWEFADSKVRNKQEYVHGEIANGTIIRSAGYLTLISEYATGLSVDITEEIGNKLRGIDLRLAYKLGGYTDKKYIKLYADQSSPNSVNSSVLIPDEDFQVKLIKSAPRLSLTYSGVIVTRTGSGFAVRGYDQNKPYFIAETGKNNGEIVAIKSGSDSVEVAKEGSGRNVIVPYGTEFANKAEIVDFLIGLGRYQSRQGFRFNNVIEGTSGEKNDWFLAAKEFLFWTQQGWDNDIAITLSPVGAEINYRSDRGAVDAITNRPYGSRILNNNFEIIDNKNYTVNRDGRNFSLKTVDNTGIYLADLDVVDYEHVIVLNNTTRFNDVIYQPQLGNRQFRIKISGFKTGAWDGTFGAAGFIINDNNIAEWMQGKNYFKGEIVLYKEKYYTASKNIPGNTIFDTNAWIETEYGQIESTLLPNLANKAGQPKSFYNFNEANLELDADKLGKGLIGFAPRDYLNNLGISDTSQVKFYQGLIRQKGSNNSLNKLLRARLDNFDGNAEFFEQWAIKDGSYGSTANTRETRIPIPLSNSTNKNPMVIELLDQNDNSVSGRVTYKKKDLITYQRPYNKNIISYRNPKKSSQDLPSAGFIKVNEVDYISPTLSRVGEFLDNNVTDGSRVWVGINNKNTWNVYRFTDNNINVNNISINGVGIATITTTGNHGLSAQENIYIKTFSNSAIAEYYSVVKVIDSNTFTINTSLGQARNLQINAKIYTLIELKQNDISGIPGIEPTNGWKNGDQFYLENATDIGWGIYEKNSRYSTVNRYSDAEAATNDNLGVSVAAARNNNYLLAGSSATQTVQAYKKLPNGNIVEGEEIVAPSNNLIGFGSVISASSAEYAAVGSPDSNGNTGYVHILRRNSTGDFNVEQALAALNFTGGSFGEAISLSDDARWLYIGQPDYLEGYVWVYQLIQADTNTTQQFFGDGSTVNFTLTGDAATLGTSIYAVQIFDNDDKIYIPFRDYIFDSSTKVITFIGAPPIGEITVYFKNYYSLVLAATLSETVGDRFAASLATSTDGSQVIIGAPNADDNSSLLSDSGKVYIVDRTVESQYANGTATVFSTALTINGVPLVKVDGDVKIETADYTFDGVDTITFNTAPASGSVVTIDTNNAKVSQVLIDFESVQENAEFGYSLDLCPTNCSLYIGAPFEDDTTIDGGKVHRFINQGRFFGTVVGSVVNPTISGPSTISLNNFYVSYSGGENLLAIANAINIENIPGVTALTINNVLTIETDRTIFADKLNIVQLSGSFLEDTGIEVYSSQQVIESPRDKNYNNFGKVVKISPDAGTLAVGTDQGDAVLTTTFDSNSTSFDRRNTTFFSNRKQSGSVMVYQLITKPNSTVGDPSQFIFAEELTASDIAEFDQFGASIDISNNTIYVGAPGNDYDNVVNSGLIYGFVNRSGLKTWNLIRSENQKVDLHLVNNAYIYNTLTGEKIIDLDIIDPAKGRVSGTAQQEINYQTTVDPAFYNNNTNVSKGIVWGKDHVGEIWWNTGLSRWVEYEQDTVEYRAVNWGFSFPGSRIICVEWTESSVPPENYSDPENPDAYPISLNNYNTFSEYNERTGGFVNKYYFWVAAKIRAPKGIANRRISSVQIEELIANPKSNNVPYIAFFDSNSFGLFNVSEYLNDNTAVVVNCDVQENNNIIHSEYELISQGDESSVPSVSVYNKLIDSLSGQDSSGNLVPDINLNSFENVGTLYRPRQTLFADRRNAVREAVEYINRFMINIPVVYSKNITNLTAIQPFPELFEYNEAVNNFVELGYLNISILPTDYLVLVRSDETTRNRWVIYKKQADNTWIKNRVQSFNNNRYLMRVNWTDPSIKVPAIVQTIVDFEYNLQQITAVEGDFVKIQDNGTGLFKIVLRENNTWRTVQEENGTIQISENIWKTENNLQGWDQDGFGLQLFDDWPSTEIRNIFNAVYYDVFVDNHKVEKNLWFVHMINYAISKTKYSDWAFKTSLIKVNQNQRALQQIPVFQQDNQDLIQEYIEEVKPYHTKISEFVLSYDSNDLTSLRTTDFDLPAYYNFATESYRSPTGLSVEDDLILQLDPYIDWTNNYTLELDDVNVFHGGSGYLSPPRLTVIGGGGSGAAVEAIVSSGVIVDVVVTNRGFGYVTTPSIIIDQFSFNPAILNVRMINRKVRSFDTTIKFDRVSTTAGWLVQFRDAFGNPVDVRNERISRLSGQQGVIDEVLELLSVGAWVVDTEAETIVYPVNNVPEYRIFNDNSGRVQFSAKRDNIGWTPLLLQNFIRSLGASVGINNLDVRGTTVVQDGSFALYQNSLLDWIPGYAYLENDLILYNNNLYRVTESFTAPSAFIDTFLATATGNDVSNHLDRTWAFYRPTEGMLGRDLKQLFKGITFPGEKIIGAKFNQNPGFDVAGYDSEGFDTSIIGPEGVAVLDPSILDQTITSRFLDTELGTNPEDLINQGGSFVDTYHSHAPEEMIPGIVFDTMSVMVHTLSTNAVQNIDGYSPRFDVNNYIGNGVTRRFGFGSDSHRGDYFLVYTEDTGPRYRKISETGQTPPGTVVLGGYYHISQQQAYSIDWINNELVFDQPIASGDVLKIINIGQVGQFVIADEVFVADGSTAAFTVKANFIDVGNVLVLINGVETSNYTIVENNSLCDFVFDTIPVDGEHIHIIASENFESNTISKVYTQLEQINSGLTTVSLDENLRKDRSKDSTVIVELNGTRLRPGNSEYYIGDGSTTVYLLPSSASEVYTSLSVNDVQVWINSERQNLTNYTLSTTDGSTIPTVIFYTAPAAGDDISITYTAQAEYFIDEADGEIRLSPSLTISNGSLLAITSFSDHDVYRIKTKVFVGTDLLITEVLTESGFDEIGFDSNGFDGTGTVNLLRINYNIDENQNIAERLFITIDGNKLIAGYNYTVVNGVITISNEFTILDTTEIVVTWFSPNIYTVATTFQIFKDMNDNFNYYRISEEQSTTLAVDLKITDTTITVVNDSALINPDPTSAIPGAVIINGERITYFQKNGNVLSQIRRGTAGTGARLIHAAGSIVSSVGEDNKIPNSDQGTWYNVSGSSASDGSGLQGANTIPARFIKEQKGIIPKNI